MYIPRRELSRTFLSALLICAFLGLAGATIMRPADPHPGLKDEALKEALRGDWKHKQLSYYQARKHLWGDIDGNGRRATDAYTGEEIKYVKQPLPYKGAVDHAWTITRLPAEARSDLHHMYPVAGETRVARLNLHFGKVRVPVWSRGGSRSGPSAKVVPVFEVRKEHRGDVARAMFYVSTMYKVEIPAAEEKVLRQWHKEDPVSATERARQKQVEKRQNSRNPFIDHPSMVDRISKF